MSTFSHQIRRVFKLLKYLGGQLQATQTTAQAKVDSLVPFGDFDTLAEHRYGQTLRQRHQASPAARAAVYALPGTMPHRPD